MIRSTSVNFAVVYNNAKNCPAYDKGCHKCNRRNHFKASCPQEEVERAVEDSGQLSFPVSTLVRQNKNIHRWRHKLGLGPSQLERMERILQDGYWCSKQCYRKLSPSKFVTQTPARTCNNKAFCIYTMVRP